MTMASPPLPPMPPTLPYAYDKDGDHLQILSICWYVLAALKLLVACFMLLYLAFGMIMTVVGLVAGAAAGKAAHDPGAAMVGLPFAGLGIFVMVLMGCMLLFVLTMAFLDWKVAQSLKKRRNHTLCFVMAIIVCLNLPLGTLLGVFTLVVLSRPSVKATFT